MRKHLFACMLLGRALGVNLRRIYIFMVNIPVNHVKTNILLIKSNFFRPFIPLLAKLKQFMRIFSAPIRKISAPWSISAPFSNYFSEGTQILNTSGSDANGLISDAHGSGNYFLFKWILNWPLKYEFNIQDPNGVTLLDSNGLANPILDNPTLHYTTGWKDGEVWVSKNIGVIKYKFRDGSIWELVDYHVIQN